MDVGLYPLNGAFLLALPMDIFIGINSNWES